VRWLLIGFLLIAALSLLVTWRASS